MACGPAKQIGGNKRVVTHRLVELFHRLSGKRWELVDCDARRMVFSSNEHCHPLGIGCFIELRIIETDRKSLKWTFARQC